MPTPIPVETFDAMADAAQDEYWDELTTAIGVFPLLWTSGLSCQVVDVSVAYFVFCRCQIFER